MMVVCIDGDWTLRGRPIRGPELGLVYEIRDIAYHRDDPDLLMGASGRPATLVRDARIPPGDGCRLPAPAYAGESLMWRRHVPLLWRLTIALWLNDAARRAGVWLAPEVK